jgi:hypothetical protein
MKYKLYAKEQSKPLLPLWKKLVTSPYKHSIGEAPDLQHLLHGGYDIGHVTYFPSRNHLNGLI